MSNELINPSALFAQQSEQSGQMMKEVNDNEWIPTLAIGYATSESVMSGVAKPGEFVLSGQLSLGNAIEAVALDFRAHAVVVDKDDNTFESHFYVGSEWEQSGKSLDTNEEWKNYTEQTVPEGKEIQKGMDLFLYIPASNTFASIFCKKTLLSAANLVWRASKGGRLVEIKTIRKSNKKGNRHWYGLDVAQLNRGIVGSPHDVEKDIALPADIFTKFYTMFKSVTNVEKTTDDGVER